MADGVKTHTAWGLGVYAFLRNAGVNCLNDFKVPQTIGVQMFHLVAMNLNRCGGEGSSVINETGKAANRENSKSVVTRYP